MTTATPPPDLSYVATLAPFTDGSEHAADMPGSWYITHGLGTPAGGTYTEVHFGDNARIDPEGNPWPPAVLDEVVRRVALDLYGRAWAFTYPPEEAGSAIRQWSLRRRERVAVTRIDVYS